METALTNLAPPTDLSPFEQLIVNAAIALASAGKRVTAEAIAEAIGMPPVYLEEMWHVRPVEDGQ